MARSGVSSSSSFSLSLYVRDARGVVGAGEGGEATEGARVSRWLWVRREGGREKEEEGA